MPDSPAPDCKWCVSCTWEKTVVVLWRLSDLWASGETLCERKWGDWMDQHQANLGGAGLHVFTVSFRYWWPYARRWHGAKETRRPNTNICWDRTWESTEEPASLPSHFFFQKIANVNKLSVHTCFGIWMETLVCALPPVLLPPYLSTFAKWVVLAQPQTNSELFC